MGKYSHLLPNLLPNDPRHLVTIQFDDWAFHDNFVHLVGFFCIPKQSQVLKYQNEII
jgi:hypothetical protein